MMMKPNNVSILFKFIILLQYLSIVCVSQSQSQDSFDFFYFVLQWPGAYCDTKQSCCYPKTGKPASDFGIHGLWPNYKDGSWPSNCDPDSVFDKSQISDLISSMEKEWPSLSCPSSNGMRFWSHEWEKHGTCAESELDIRDYFGKALQLKHKLNLLNILNNAGIEADDGFYSLESISEAVKEGLGFTPGIECNRDSAHNTQLYQVYFCVDTTASDFIECPILPTTKCGSQIQFPKF